MGSAPPPPGTPPIQLLQAFECAARHSSFKRAAKELCVTPSAVSHQIRAIEESLGVDLFIRQARGVTLTRSGRAYLDVAHETLHAFAAGTRRFFEQHSRAELRVSMSAWTASEIFIPHLDDFLQRHPDLRLRIDTKDRPIDCRTNTIDLSVQCGVIGQQLPSSVVVSDVLLTLVCAPSLLERKPLASIDDLLHHQVICPAHDEPAPETRYAEAHGTSPQPASAA